MRFENNIEDRELLAKILEELTELPRKYTGVPSCAYIIGPFSIDKDGKLEVDEANLSEYFSDIISVMLEDKMITEEISESVEDEAPEYDEEFEDEFTDEEDEEEFFYDEFDEEPEVEAATEAESQPEFQPEPEPEPDNEIKTGSESEIIPESEPENEIETEIESEIIPESEPDNEIETEIESEITLESEPENEIKTGSESEITPEPEPENEIETEIESEITPEPKPENEIETEIESEITPEPKPDNEIETGSESEITPEPEPGNEIKTEIESEIILEPEPEPELVIANSTDTKERDIADFTSSSIEFPLTEHSARSIRNLLNMIYNKGSLISKSVAGNFAVSEGLIAILDETSEPDSISDLKRVIDDYESEHGASVEGLRIGDEKLTFTGFPVTQNSEAMRVFTQLADAMNEQSISKRHIKAKYVNMPNEKYAMRAWLLQIGMGSAKFKAARKFLLERLSGDMVFRTQEMRERWEKKWLRKNQNLRDEN